MMDSADPLAGWPLEQVMKKAALAKNDVYGSLFRYLRDILLQFCHGINSRSTHFRLFQVNAAALPGVLETSATGQRLFDRIEVRRLDP